MKKRMGSGTVDGDEKSKEFKRHRAKSYNGIEVKKKKKKQDLAFSLPFSLFFDRAFLVWFPLGYRLWVNHFKPHPQNILICGIQAVSNSSPVA